MNITMDGNDTKEYDKQKCQSGNHPMVNLPFHDQKHCMVCRMSESEIKFYNVVVADSRTRRDGRFVESIGYYDPTTEPATVKMDEEKALEWIAKGAQVTDTVKALLQKQGTLKKIEEMKQQARKEG